MYRGSSSSSDPNALTIKTGAVGVHVLMGELMKISWQTWSLSLEGILSWFHPRRVYSWWSQISYQPTGLMNTVQSQAKLNSRQKMKKRKKSGLNILGLEKQRQEKGGLQGCGRPLSFTNPFMLLYIFQTPLQSWGTMWAAQTNGMREEMTAVTSWPRWVSI